MSKELSSGKGLVEQSNPTNKPQIVLNGFRENDLERLALLLNDPELYMNTPGALLSNIYKRALRTINTKHQDLKTNNSSNTPTPKSASSHRSCIPDDRINQIQVL